MPPTRRLTRRENDLVQAAHKDGQKNGVALALWELIAMMDERVEGKGPLFDAYAGAFERLYRKAIAEGIRVDVTVARRAG